MTWWHKTAGHITRHKTAYVFAALSLGILGPLLLPGYILTLDMAWPPHITLPATLTNTYPFCVVLWLLNHVVPGDILQKLVLGVTFWAIGYGMFRLVQSVYRHVFHRSIPWIAGISAGIFAAVNPFTYERFMDGQWQVLTGYAALFWVAWRHVVYVGAAICTRSRPVTAPKACMPAITRATENANLQNAAIAPETDALAKSF